MGLNLHKKEIALLVRNPGTIRYLGNTRKAIQEMVCMEVARARRIWNLKASKGTCLQQVIALADVSWAIQQSILYHICRYSKPEIVVETGVNYGVSSAMILQALSDNSRGRLYSIDLPRVSYKAPFRTNYRDVSLPNNAEIGFVVPPELRERWTLTLGDSRVELPKLFHKVGPVGFFYHDSMHTREHMLFEYQTAYPRINPGGVIGSDDTTWNKAFDEFCDSKGLRPIRCFGKGFAVVPRQTRSVNTNQCVD